MVRVTQVHRTVGDALLDGAIDTPRAGAADGGHALFVNGWAVGREHPCERIEVLHRGTLLRSAAPVARPDLAAAPAFADVEWAGRSGFSVGVGVLGLPGDFALEVRAVLADGTRSGVGVVLGSRSRLEPHDPRIRPLMVTCLGRSGTSLLVQLLGGHPSVVVHPQPPYETRCATYWMHMAKVAGEPGPRLAPVEWYGRLTALDAVGPLPFYGPEPDDSLSWVTSAYPERLARFCADSLEEFYLGCATLTGKPGARFFAEKQAPGITADVLDELFPDGAELVSLRDPRDMLLSILAFLDRGNTVLGHEAGDEPDAVAAAFTEELAALAARLRGPGRVVPVRYEELLTDRRATLERVLKAVGLDGGDAPLNEMERAAADPSLFEGHRTSSGLEATLGRWRREFGARLEPLWTPALEALCIELGYPPTA